MGKNYRFDQRTKAQFKKDIKNHTMAERALFMMWLDLIEHQTGERPNFKDTGCGQDGEYLENKKVNTSPDFEVEGYGEIEVKFAKPMLKRSFHLKENQLKQYCKRGASVLMINGAEEDVPTFTILKPRALKKIMKECDVVPWQGFGGKPAYRIDVNRYVWRPLIPDTE